MVIPVGVIRSVVLLVCCVGGCIVLAAQPNVEIYWDDFDRADTVMDFGVTLEGSPVTLTFTVVNNHTERVGILLPNPSADPYYAIVNTPDLDPADPRKEEFQSGSPLPYIVDVGESGSFRVTYRALANNPAFPPDVVTEALLQLRVVSMTDSIGPSSDKTFLLRAIKTKNILSTTTPFIDFDSVYVSPQPREPERTYTLRNVTSSTIRVESQNLELKTSVVTDPEFLIDTVAAPTIAGMGSLTWKPRYHPRNIGRDSAHFNIGYKPNEFAAPDTIVAVFAGTGVQQLLDIQSATGNPNPVVVRTDTIDFGNVDANGLGGVSAQIILKNEGNVNIRLVSERESGIPRDTQAFVIERKLLNGRQDIRTNAFDTLVVRFDPINGGKHEITYEVETDLASRSIAGVPDGAQRHVYTFIGFARKPQIVVNPSEINFGTVVLLPDCANSRTSGLTIRNIGNVPLVVDSIVPTEGAAIEIDLEFPLIVGFSEDTVVPIRYTPTQVETLNASLSLYSNAFGAALEITCSGAAVARDSISVSIPASISSAPGSRIAVPIVVEAEKVARAERTSVVVTFNPSMMRYSGVEKTGTASEGSTTDFSGETQPGRLELRLRANGTFLQRDTLIMATFDTYLGDASFTDLALSAETTTFGNADCESTLLVKTTSGKYHTDSICGLSYKVGTFGGFITGASVFPNPATNTVSVAVSAQEGHVVSMLIRNSLGIAVTSPTTFVTKQGISTPSIDIHSLQPGAYFVELIRANQRITIPLMVAR